MVVIVPVPIVDDALAEVDESFDLVLSGPVNATLPDPRGTATIGRNDQPTVATPMISTADVVVGEREPYAEFVIRLSAPSSNVVSVNYSTSNGTATAGSDFEYFGSAALSFAPGETLKTVRIVIENNATAENEESFNFVLASATNATIATPRVIGTIVDNDGTAGTPVIRIRAPVVDESANEAVFAITLDRPSVATVTVSYATATGTAGSGDFTAVSGVASFAPGQMVVIVPVPIVDDALAEVDESFDLVLSGPVNATLPDPRGTALIGRNDQPTVSTPMISTADVVVGEREPYAEFVVRLSAPSSNVVSVNYSTTNGTAYSGSDYEGVASTPLSFAPGETLKTVRIAIENNTTAENDESFSFNLASATNATIATPRVIGTIIDNDG
jgi:hypothetical protein